ncbi:hypothetical protein Hanom_Chr10g00923841 [Helianthus anomalus]
MQIGLHFCQLSSSLLHHTKLPTTTTTTTTTQSTPPLITISSYHLLSIPLHLQTIPPNFSTMYPFSL